MNRKDNNDPRRPRPSGHSPQTTDPRLRGGNVNQPYPPWYSHLRRQDRHVEQRAGPSNPQPRPVQSTTEAVMQAFNQRQQELDRIRREKGVQPHIPAGTRGHLINELQLLSARSGMAAGPAKGTLPAAVAPNPRSSRIPPQQRGPPNPPRAPRTSPIQHVVKSASRHILPWQEQDAQREARLNKLQGRTSDGIPTNDDFGRRNARMTVSSRTKALPQKATSSTTADRPPKGYLSPRMSLKREGEPLEEEESSSDSSMDVDQNDNAPRPDAQTGRKRTAFKRVTVFKSGAPRMAARKRRLSTPISSEESSSTSSSEDEKEDDDDDDESSSSSSTEAGRPPSPQQEHNDSDLDSMYEDGPTVKAEDLDAPLNLFGPQEIIYIDSPPHITIALPQLASSEAPRVCPPELVAALSKIALSSVRQHETRQLPFDLRNLRNGFRLRCKDAKVDTRADKGEVSLKVKFQGAGGVRRDVTLKEWKCPVCSLMGTVPNRFVLEKHLEWDHQELFIEWKPEGYRSWTLEILVPEGLPEDGQAGPAVSHQESNHSDLPDPQVALPSIPEQPNAHLPSIEVSPPPASTTTGTPTLSNRSTFSTPPLPSRANWSRRQFQKQEEEEDSSSNLSTPAPPASLSTQPERQFQREEEEESSDEEEEDEHLRVRIRQGRRRRLHFASPTPSSFREPSTDVQSIAGRSTTVSSTTASTVTTTTTTTSTARSTSSSAIPSRITPTAFTGPDGTRYPAPPPPSDPLGPAAQPPYLPADPDYPTGHRVEYSCRPGGPTLFDLLNTLPLEPYGVLAWQVLDREEEIFDSDEVRDEYKVMHALWARWILLNRVKFLRDYAKGVRAFVDEYWRMIHRAAGWGALRYWLLLLLSNRFLTAREVANTLKYYEAYTGMDHWYERQD